MTAPTIASGIPGTPIWVDMMTDDIAAAKGFYTALFGWKYRETDDNYSLAMVDDIPVAGIMPRVTEGGQTPPTAWNLYLASADIDDTAARITRAGGSVFVGPREVSGEGRFLVAEDPTGGVIGFWQSEAGNPLRFGIDVPGTLVWADLNTRQGARADEFYAAIFDYQRVELGGGQETDYAVWALSGTPVLGRLEMGEDFPTDVPPYWAVYFDVDPALGTDETVKRAVALGAQACLEPFNTPYGRIAVLSDPTGAVFCLIHRNP